MAPRLNSRRQTARTRSVAPADPAPSPGIGDNINSAAQEEWERIQLIRFVGQLDAADIEVERAQGPYKAALASRAAIKKQAQGAGFTADELKQRREEMAATAGENARKASRETKHRKWLGITNPEQQKMHLEEGTPIEARDELDWQSEGYKRGLRGRGPDLPDGMDARFTQPFLKGHEIGWKEYLEALAQNAPKPKGMTAQQVAEQAAREFKADNPEIDVEAAARKLRNDPKFMDRSANETMTGEEVAAAATQVLSEIVDGIKGGDDTVDALGPVPPVVALARPDEPFEATEEELAAQKPRQAVQEARTSDVV
jgi:hypothetical protein